MIGFIAPYKFTELGTTANYSATVILHTSQFTVAHGLGFLAFTFVSRQRSSEQSHCNINSHLKLCRHSLIPFLSFLLNRLVLPSPELDPVPFYASLYSVPSPDCPLITPRLGFHGKQRLLLLKSTLTAPLPSNWSPIVERVGSCGNVYRPIAMQWVYVTV
jgi:hypothetical protein